LQAAGVPTRYHEGLGLIHGFFGLGEACESARIEAQRARADFKALLAREAVFSGDERLRA
jgi:acetyl esterase